MSSESAGGSVNSPLGTGAVNPDSATSGVTADLKAEMQKIIAGMMKDMVPRAIKASLTESLPQALAPMLEALQGRQETQKAAPAAAGNHADDEGKLTLKAMADKLAALQSGIEKANKDREVSDTRLRDLRRETAIKSEFAKHLGADSPHLPAYTKLYGEQFVDVDGQIVRKSKSDYGEEVLTPADAAIADLFKGDLKHLVVQDKSRGLPVSGFSTAGNGQTRLPNGVPPLLAEVANHFLRNGDNASAAQFMQSVVMPIPPDKK